MTQVPSLDFFHLFICFIWILYYGIRLIQHSRNHEFFKMPWLILWINGYVFGLCYVVNNYSTGFHIDHTLFEFTTFPILLVAKLSIYSIDEIMFFIMLRNYSPYYRSWTHERILLISFFISFAIIVGLWFQSQPYHVLFWMTDILLYINACIAVMLLLHVARRIKITSISQLEFIHFIWLAICTTLAGIALIFTTISAIDGLVSQRLVVMDNWLSIGYVFFPLALLCMAILTSPDEFIYRTGLMLRWLQIRRLSHLYLHILSSIDIDERYPFPPFRPWHPSELAIYNRVVAILDIYPFLKNDHPLFMSLQTIERNHEDPFDCADALVRLRVR